MSVYPSPNFFKLSSVKSIIYYIFKCGLHFLAMFKFFQRIIFACLLNEFFHVLALSYIAMIKFFFSIFQFKFSVFFIKFEISNPVVGYCQFFHVLRFWHPYMNKQILLVYEIGKF